MLSNIYKSIDAVLHWIAMAGSIAIIALVTITMYDVSTRYFDLPKFSGLNSTMVQEAEYWAHGFLLCLVIGYGYTRQAHVRIDLVRDTLSLRAKYWVEIAGIVFLLLPFALISAYYSFHYVMRSYIDAEISPSTNGLTNFWIFKSAMFFMFCLIALAGISQLVKCIDGLRGNLNEEQADHLLGGGH